METSNNIKLPSNKKFGFLFILIFSLVNIYTYVFDLYIWFWISLLLNLFFIICTLIKPSILTPFNKLWMKFGYLLSKIISPIIISLIFFIIFTPVSLFFKIIGRDILEIKTNKKSNWKTRNNDDTNFDLQF